MWKSRSVSSALPIALCFIAAGLIGPASVSAHPTSEVLATTGEFRRSIVAPGFSPLRDLYAGRPLGSLDLDRLGSLDLGQMASLAADSTPPRADDPAPESAPKVTNPRKALMLSLLLPGAGELYAGHKGRATGFFVAEGAIWAHFAAWEIAGHLRKDDYIEQAQLNAGVGVESESDDYWRLVGTYARSSGTGADAYEDALRREARNEFPSDPAAQDAYVAERLPTGDRAWTWSSAELQSSYRETRQNATRAFNRAKFSFALAILNRLVSAIDTQVLHRRDTKAAQSAADAGTRLLTVVTADGGKVLIRHSF